jgi:hypothetical protein
MKLLTLRSSIALLTFMIGVTAATLPLFRGNPSGLNRVEAVRLANPPQPAESPAQSTREQQSLDDMFIEGDRLSYAGYDVERSYDSEEKVSSAVIRKEGKTVVALRDGGLGPESTEIGLFPFRGGETKQLVIMQYTGGAHCCSIYRIYELTPKLRLIFNDEEYGIDSVGNGLQPEDLDGDGRYELLQSVMTFDYFHMSHASSVFPTAIFSYDEKARKYLPANRRFSTYLLEGIEGDLKHLEEERAKLDGGNDIISLEAYRSAVLQVTLKYIYAGRRADGWQLFEREYQLSDKDEIRADLKKLLATDPVYQSIYR